MTNGPATRPIWHRPMNAASPHLQNLLDALRRCSPWVLAIPLGVIALVLSDYHVGVRWFAEKATQEIIAPNILAVAAFLAFLHWARAGDFYARWLALLTAALFCRELHFWGTNNGIYFIVLALLVYASYNWNGMRPLLENRAAVSLFFGALATYALTKTFDRAYWSFIGGWTDWQDTMEESLESTAHVLILSLSLVSYVAWGRRWRRGEVAQAELPARLKVWGVQLAAAAAAMFFYASWYGEDEPPPRPPGRFPLELSSLCNVHPKLGDQLFLASSDEERKLTLWTLDQDGKPSVVQRLPLEIPQQNGDAYFLDDLEDIAWDGADTYYAIGSHRHIVPDEDESRKKKSHATECALVSFQLAHGEDGYTVSNARTVTTELLPKIRQLGVFPSIDWTRSKIFSWRGLVKTWQLDVEGLAFVDGRLLIGFKSPIEQGRATILSYDPATDELAVAARPDLGGQGILGLHYDPAGDRLLLVSNNTIKHRYGDSCLWIGRRSDQPESAWSFATSDRVVLESASARTSRKASGVTIRDGKLAVCFDSETESPIRVLAMDEVLPRY